MVVSGCLFFFVVYVCVWFVVHCVMFVRFAFAFVLCVCACASVVFVCVCVTVVVVLCVYVLCL